MPKSRFALLIVTGGGLVCSLVALLIFVTIQHALREHAALRHDALSEGYWIVKALEVSHRVMQPGHAAAMRTLLQHLTGSHGLRSVLLLDDRKQVLLASEAPLEGTRWPGILDVPREGGRIMTSTSDTMVLAFPASFADAAEPAPDALHHVTWILLELDVSTAAAHARTVFWHAVFVALGAVLLGGVAFVFLGTMQRYALARAAVARLEQITHHLARFVPGTVQRLIEANPDRPMFDKVAQEVTVLFLDIDRYTTLSHTLAPEALNRLIETYFSVFLDRILAHGGDINETAGDGVMAIFTDVSPRGHALHAVRAALTIQEQTATLNRTRQPPAPAIRVNIGINTGQALLGVTMMHGTAGERCTYTASGEVTNIAARLCDLGKRGEVHLSQTTAQLVQEYVQVQGPFAARLKHVQGTVLVYKLKEHLRRPI